MGDHEFEFFGCGGCRKSVTMTSNVFERHPCLNTRSATRQQSPFGLRILGTQDACSDISNRGILSMMFLSLLSTVVGAPVVHKLTNDLRNLSVFDIPTFARLLTNASRNTVKPLPASHPAFFVKYARSMLLATIDKQNVELPKIENTNNAGESPAQRVRKFFTGKTTIWR